MKEVPLTTFTLYFLTGTVLIVEDPFVGFLGNTFGWDTKHCYYCFKMIKRGIPCENCVFVSSYVTCISQEKSLEMMILLFRRHFTAMKLAS